MPERKYQVNFIRGNNMFKYKTHSNVLVSKSFQDYNGKEIRLEAKKLSAYTVSSKLFSISKSIGTAVGAGIDNSKVAMTWTAFTHQINENLHGELFEEIRDLMFQELYHGDVKVDLDWWDENDTIFLEVFFWLLKENFGNFIVRNGMFQQWKKKLEDLVGTDLTQKLEEMLNNVN